VIAVDTSALLAVVLDEPAADACIAAMEAERDIRISGGTLAEALLVARQRGVDEALNYLVRGMPVTVVEVTERRAHRVAAAHSAWGKGVHPAALNFGDCFAYALAAEYGCPLLYVGQDFAKTDIISAL